jgi:hypothetical protein
MTKAFRASDFKGRPEPVAGVDERQRESRLAPARAAVEEPWPPGWDDVPLHELIDGRDWHTLPPAYWRKIKPRQPRGPSLIRAIRTARKAGVDKGTVTVGGVSVSFGESDPVSSRNPWLDDINKATRQ